MDRVCARPQKGAMFLVYGLDDPSQQTDHHGHMDRIGREHWQDQHRAANQSGQSTLPGKEPVGDLVHKRLQGRFR